MWCADPPPAVVHARVVHADEVGDPTHLVAPDLGEQRLGGDVVAAGDHPLGEGALAGAELLVELLPLVSGVITMSTLIVL